MAAKQALEYLSLRPWLENLDATDLSKLNFDHSSKLNQFSTENISGSISQIKTKRSDISFDYTWQAFRSLQSPAPPFSEKQRALRINGLWILELFSDLNNWAMNPHHSEMCNKDYDLDGYQECVLSNKTTFAVANPQKNILHLLAVQNPCSSQASSATENCGYTQIIGPTSQIIYGHADSTTWNLFSGAYADPGTLVGAQFLTAKNSGLTTDDITILMPQIGSISYQLLNYGIKITGNNLGCSSKTNILKIPLIIAPESRLLPNWESNYILEEVKNGILAGWRHGPSVAMTTNTTFEINSFIMTSKMDNTQENPDYEYPPGHFLPMGVTVIELQACGEFWVEFQLENKRDVAD